MGALRRGRRRGAGAILKQAVAKPSKATLPHAASVRQNWVTHGVADLPVEGRRSGGVEVRPGLRRDVEAVREAHQPDRIAQLRRNRFDKCAALESSGVTIFNSDAGTTV